VTSFVAFVEIELSGVTLMLYRVNPAKLFSDVMH